MLAILASAPLHASTPPAVAPYEDYSKRIQAAGAIEPLATDLFGERTNLYNGATEFSVVDISIPGTGPAVELRRRFKVATRKDYVLGGFGAWDIDVPHLTGMFGAGKWDVDARGATQRCSANFLPQQPHLFDLADVWSGVRLHLPGGGDHPVFLIDSDKSLPVPTDGKTYHWWTHTQHRLSCLPSTRNGYFGEAFVAVDQEGTRYTFDVGTERNASPVQRGAITAGQLTIVQAGRVHVYLLASRVEDRHGNWVQYHYDGAQLSGITASDGRSIVLARDANGNIVRAMANGRTWHYHYGAQTVGWGAAGTVLTSVVQPDGSQWKYAYAGNESGVLLSPIYQTNDGSPGDGRCLPPPEVWDRFSITATHPSGAVGEFSFDHLRHHRSDTPAQCVARFNHLETWIYELTMATFSDSFSLSSKSISGPGLAARTWQYGYVDGAPKRVTVTQPDGSKRVSLFGTRYHLDDGLLVGEEVIGVDGKVLQSRRDTFVTPTESRTLFPDLVGLMGGGDDPAASVQMPIRESRITRDGVDFVLHVDSFDEWGRNTATTRSSSLGFSRSETTEYHDDKSVWALGQVRKTTLTAPGTPQVLASTKFGAQALPETTWQFGALERSYTWHADGNLQSLSDAKGNTTTFASWRRGVPRFIEHADGTSLAAGVDDNGWIEWARNEIGATTTYTYDAMGRLARIQQPEGDTVQWHDTVLTFAPETQAAFGLPPGHWKQRIKTGDAIRDTHFDALWRPVVSMAYDDKDVSNTIRHVARRHDDENREIFRSTPRRDLADHRDDVAGVRTWRDALGRVTRVEQDSELGPLVTTTEALPGLHTRVTDARGNATTTQFMAYDAPDAAWPIEARLPDGITTEVTRDRHGKPLAIVRRNADGTTSLARTYAYDAQERLCKTVEPETGATVLDYDAAGNLSWSAAGLMLEANGQCDRAAAAASGRRAIRAYDSRNRLVTLDFPDGNGSQQWSYGADGQVARIDAANDGALATNRFAYNLRGMMVSETQELVGDEPWTLRYTHSAHGDLASIQYPSGHTVDVAPNALGEATKTGSAASAVKRHPDGAVSSYVLANGFAHSASHNTRGMLDRVREARGTIVASDLSYDYDANGNVAAISDGSADGRAHRTMAYDAVDRLVGAASPIFGEASYRYDVLDNLVEAHVGQNQLAYVRDGANRLTNLVDLASGSSIVGMGYDAHGNLSNRNGKQFEFDHGNRLRQVAGVERYAYDGFGRRTTATLASHVGAQIRSMYGHDGVLRHQRDRRSGESSDYITLDGKLVARRIVPAAPAAPVLTAPGYSTTGSYPVAWSSLAPASFELEERAVDAWELMYAGPAFEFPVAGKEAGHWQYRVRACNAAGCGEWSAVVVVSVQRLPHAPGSIKAPSTGPSGNYTVEWTPPAVRSNGANRYLLEERAGVGTWGTAYEGEALAFTFSGKPSGLYRYRVATCNPWGCSHSWKQAMTCRCRIRLRRQA